MKATKMIWLVTTVVVFLCWLYVFVRQTQLYFTAPLPNVTTAWQSDWQFLKTYWSTLIWIPILGECLRFSFKRLLKYWWV